MLRPVRFRLSPPPRTQVRTDSSGSLCEPMISSTACPPRDSVCRFDPGGLGKNNLGRRQERVWRAHRLGAKVYAVTTSAGGRDRAPTLESRKSPANCGLFVTGQHVEYSNARLVRNVRAARQHILHTRRHGFTPVFPRKLRPFLFRLRHFPRGVVRQFEFGRSTRMDREAA